MLENGFFCGVLASAVVLYKDGCSFGLLTLRFAVFRFCHRVRVKGCGSVANQVGGRREVAHGIRGLFAFANVVVPRRCGVGAKGVFYRVR